MLKVYLNTMDVEPATIELGFRLVDTNLDLWEEIAALPKSVIPRVVDDLVSGRMMVCDR